MKKNKATILVIDDDLGILKLLNKWLNVDGKDFTSAQTGEEGIETAKLTSPSLILLDIMLPGIGGTETARKLQNDPTTKNIPIIFMTACMGVETDKGDEEIVVDNKTYRAFAKPLHNRKLLSVIRKTLNSVINNN